jgi:Tol biopolymer transport system component
MRLLRSCTGALAALALGVLLVAGCGGSGERPSPDIVFVSTRGDDYAIYGMNADGSDAQRLSQGEEGDPSTPAGLFFQTDPAWSPDGLLIAFSSRRDGVAHIFVMRADGTGTRRLTAAKGDDSHPTWSPDGDRIAFSRGSPGDIYVMRADGTGARRVGLDQADEQEPAWSPDGRWLAYVRREPGTPSRELWLMHPDGSGRRQLTRLNAVSTSPAWSPDSRTIAFSSDTGGTTDIYTIGVDGKRLRRVTGSTGEAFEPSWSPDGRTIAFSRDGSIVALRLGSLEETELTDQQNDSSPAWRPVQPPASG